MTWVIVDVDTYDDADMEADDITVWGPFHNEEDARFWWNENRRFGFIKEVTL